MAAESAVRIIFLGDSAGAVRSVSRLEGAFSGLGRTAKLVTGALGIALVGGLAAATKAAIDFQHQMELIRTQAGASQKEVDNMSKALLNLAGAVGTTPDALAKGLFHVESAGVRGANALHILTAAAKGAKVGQADLELVTNALVGAFKSGIKGAGGMEHAMAVLNAAVGAGNMRMNDLAGALGTGLLSKAAAVGLSLQDVTSAVAELTVQGQHAEDAATRLSMAFLSMAAPSGKKAIDALKSIGLTQNSLANDMRNRGLIPTLEILKAHLEANGRTATEQTQILAAVFGRRSLQGILPLLQHLTDLKNRQDQINKTTGNFGAAWEATSHTVQFQLDKAKASIIAAAIPLGQLLLPAVAKAAQGVASAATFIQQHMSGMEGAVHGFVDAFVTGFHGVETASGQTAGSIHHNAGAIGADVTQMGSRWDRILTQMGRDSAELRAKVAANWGPIIAQGKVLAADIRSSFNSIHQAIQAVRPIIDSLGPEFKVAIAIAVLQLRLFLFWCRLAFQGAAAAIKLVAGPLSATINAFNHLAGAGVSAAKTFASGVTSAFHAVEAAVSAVVSVIEKLIGIVKSIPHDVSIHIHVPGAGIVSGAVGAIGGALGHIPHAGGGIIPLLPGTTKGADSVPALLTPGEMVLNQKQQDALGGQSALARMFGFGQMARFAAGGVAGKKPGATPHKGRGHRSHTKAIPPWASPQIAAALRHLHTLDDDKSYLDQEYSNLSTRFTIEDDDFSFVNSDGTINTGFVAQRSAELRDLIAERQKLYDKMEEQKRALVAAVKMLRKAIGILLRNLRANEVGIRHDAEQLSKLSSELAKEKGKKKPNAGRVKSLEGSIKAVRADISNRGTAKGNINRARATWGQQIADWGHDLRFLPLDEGGVLNDILDLQQQLGYLGAPASILQHYGGGAASAAGGGAAAPPANVLGLAQAVGALQANIIGSFQKGTLYVPETGLAMVHTGETITPAGVAGGGGSQPVQVMVHVTVEDGAVDKNKIRAEVVKATDAISLSMGRSASERLRGNRI